jgi:hypothetical protein
VPLFGREHRNSSNSDSRNEQNGFATAEIACTIVGSVGLPILRSALKVVLGSAQKQRLSSQRLPPGRLLIWLENMRWVKNSDSYI